MDTIPRFKKIEALSLGIVLPVFLSGYTVLLLLNSEAVFWAVSYTHLTLPTICSV